MALQRSIGNAAVTRLIQQSRQEQREESARHIPTVQRAESAPGAYAQVAPAGGIATFTAGNLLVAFVPAGTTGQQLASYLALVPAGSVVVLQRPILDLAAVAVHSGFHAAYPAATGEAEVQHDGFGSPMGWTVTSPAGATHELPGPNLTLRNLESLHLAAAAPAPALQPDSPESEGWVDDFIVDDSSDIPIRASSPTSAQSDSGAAPEDGLLTEEQAENLFEVVKRNRFVTSTGEMQEIPWDQVENGCSERAHLTARLLMSAGVPCRRVFAVCTADPEETDEGLWIESEAAGDGRPGSPARIGFGFHTAVTVQVRRDDGGIDERVFDPSIAPGGPITIGNWLATMHVAEDEILVLGESHREVVSSLQGIRNVPQNDEGYPEDHVSVFCLEPEAYHYPQVNPATRAHLNPQDGPPGFTMDDADAAFLERRHVLEEQVEEARRRRS